MGKKEDFFKWYRENADKLSWADRIKADETAAKYSKWHDGLENAVRNTPEVNQEAWLAALEQMDWEDAKFQFGSNGLIDEHWLRSYYDHKENVRIQYYENDKTIQIYRTYHTAYGDVVASWRPIDVTWNYYLSAHADGIPEAVKEYYLFHETHTQEEIETAIKEGRFNAYFKLHDEEMERRKFEDLKKQFLAKNNYDYPELEEISYDEPDYDYY